MQSSAQTAASSGKGLSPTRAVMSRLAPLLGNVRRADWLRQTGRALLPVAVHPRPPCRTLRYVSNPSLRVFALKDLLPCALQ
jgi:hypothetical protein